MGRTQYLPGQLPLFLPDSNWKSPTELPDLRHLREIALDTETKDISLSAGRGPGWATNNVRICGVSVAWEEGAFYAPLNHPDTECFDPILIKNWIETHDAAGVKFITHNASYDFGSLNSDLGVRFPKLIDDTIAMAVMVDENRTSFSLDNVSQWLGIPGKDEHILNEAAAAYGFANDVKSNLWRLPGRFVGPYAEQDAIATLKIAQILREKIKEEETEAAYQLEVDLIPLVFEMRKKGIRIDTDRADFNRKLLIKQRDLELQLLGNRLHQTISMTEINSARHVEKWFTKEKIPFNRTPKSQQGQFDIDSMEKNPHWLPQSITRIRQIEMGQSKFLQGFLLDYAHKGRIHASINQFRGEEGGTRSHRFSYSDPPLQQMYGRGKTELKDSLVDIIRGCFLPEDGELWGSIDYSQQEYRLIVHFAELLKCRKANLAGDRYRTDPSTDFHRLAADMTKLDRSKAKDVNFAKAFGAGNVKFALMTGMLLDEAKQVMAQYDEELPFVKDASDICKGVAAKRGFIRLIDGARCHFDQWEPAYRDWDEEALYRGSKGCAPCTLEEAKDRVNDQFHPWDGRIVRAFTHKAFNRAVQGSAARQTKKAMRDCYREGFIPLLQMHDELCFSLRDPNQGIRISEMMRNAVKLTVPMKTDTEYGISWGSARKIESKDKKILYGASWQEAMRLKTEGKWW